MHQRVLMLGARTGWTRTEILELSSAEFDCYCQTLINMGSPGDA